jgi:hypothetical protein
VLPVLSRFEPVLSCVLFEVPAQPAGGLGSHDRVLRTERFQRRRNRLRWLRPEVDSRPAEAVRVIGLLEAGGHARRRGLCVVEPVVEV